MTGVLIVVGVFATLLVIAFVAYLIDTGGGSRSGSGDVRAEALCDMLDANRTTAPDQLARRVYGDGAFASAAAGVRAECVADHGPVAVYLDETANFDGGYVPQVPPGYGTASQ